MSGVEVLQAGTRTAARVLGLQDEIRTIEVGKGANIIAALCEKERTSVLTEVRLHEALGSANRALRGFWWVILG